MTVATQTRKPHPSSVKEVHHSGNGFNLTDYLQGVKLEWHKITWPPQAQVIAETGVVLLVVLVFSTFVYIVDKLLQLLIQLTVHI
jgi:preprotein translocase subunit SecE